jgi:hypothetical protein
MLRSTINRSVCLGIEHPSEAYDQIHYCQTVAGLLMWGALSDERTVLSFPIAAGLASAIIFGSESRGIHDHILLSQIRDFTFRRLLRLAGLWWKYSTPSPHGFLPTVFIIVSLIYGTDHVENTHLNYFIVACYESVATMAYQPPLFRKPLPSNDCCIAAYSAVFA